MAKKTKASNLSLEEKLEQALIPNWDEPYKLPDNWCWVKLEKLTSITAGGTPSRGNKLYWDNGNIPWVKISDLSGKYVETTEEKITQLGLENSSAKIFKKGTILYSIFATIGDVAILNIEAATNQALAGITCTPACDLDYMYYVLLVLKDLLVAKAKGVAQVNINQSILKETPIPLAPLTEQHRIVARIESLFAKLDEAKEKAQEVVDGFETRKAAILHKAFSGELTQKWREENEVSSTSWKKYTYAQLGTSKLGKMLDKSKNTGIFVPYLRNVNVRWFGFDLSDVAQMRASDEEIELLSVKKGDLFICEGGEPGRCAIWKDEDSNIIFQKALHRFRPNSSVISDFLCYYLYFMSINGMLVKHFTGSTIKHLTGQSLARIEITIPNIDEQKQIVSILNRLFEKENQSKETAEAVIEQIDTMKKAILARAFRGELGTNDPSEENAVELVKKILCEDAVSHNSTWKPTKRIMIPADIKELLSNVREEAIIKLLLRSAPLPVSIQEIMSLSSKKFELLEALRTLEKKQLITKNESGEYSLMR